ncbi:phosphoribosylformylglycinamidine cyclo-ligase [Cardiobacterium valvarum]|uniref:Phosphoribosylformylglycinamidine cyclo-ligase n=1 Tax=Cardiobacterium valvarum F0432 TaxID=797473 RepID=G9ZJ30_9GAMM|nr:phosphoribosylformylglycinamidine cyclo-ligase [Cardiobacterium valvarum]EHM50474.1 phosphoribosylformylglycinamidine cyclo-ligase [Cardiobacterium valvarum F0432]
MNLDYKSAGVDKEAGYDTVERIKQYAGATHNARVLGQIGAFGAFYDLGGYKHPILVSGTDGVGTKLKIAFALEKYDTIGIDAVAMCVNDILCHGAAPQYFLDYLACGKLEPAVAADIVKGVAEGCTQAGAALIGGETAEMPGFYQAGEYDIAGFAVGVVEKDDLIDGSKVEAGDILIGLPSSGYHSNGYSLLRKIFTDLSVTRDGKTIGEHLLTPTKIYVKPVLDVLGKHRIHGLAHITGGGLPENLPRAYRKGLTAVVDTAAFPTLPLVDTVLQHVKREESYGTFNMGIGFILIAPASEADAILATLQTHGEAARIIGEMQSGDTPLILR